MPKTLSWKRKEIHDLLFTPLKHLGLLKFGLFIYLFIHLLIYFDLAVSRAQQSRICVTGLSLLMTVLLVVLLITDRVVLASGSIVPTSLRKLKWWPVLAIKARGLRLSFARSPVSPPYVDHYVWLLFSRRRSNADCRCSGIFEKAVVEGSTTHQKEEREKKESI